nr:hypothetical protein [Escherichia coli]
MAFWDNILLRVYPVMLKALITLEARVVHPLLPNCSQGAVRRKAYGGGSPRRRRTRQVMV